MLEHNLTFGKQNWKQTGTWLPYSQLFLRFIKREVCESSLGGRSRRYWEMQGSESPSSKS